VYNFRLTVTNSAGLTASDDVVITVNGAITSQPPVANAGKDETITVGQATVLHGENSMAPGGYIKTYLWSKLSGPETCEILTPSASSTWIRNMVAGTYVYRLTVTDNNGSSAFDDVMITVTSILAAPIPSDFPVAQAGPDVTITFPASSVILDASASTAPGSFITKYNWSYVSGPAAYYITTPIAVTTEIKNLVQGVYTFRLTVTNNAGKSASDDIVITVKPAITNAPVANAGKDETLAAGQATVLHGENSYAMAGYIKGYSWTKISGPDTYEILSPTASYTWIRNMVPGVYVFRLTVTDNYGATGIDDVVITVTGSSTTIANAGKDEVIPVGQATVLHGEYSSCTGGQIVSYMWTKISGPSGYEILTPAAATTWIRNMVAGSYVYRLTVTDDKGNKSVDDVVITVSASYTMLNRRKQNQLSINNRPDLLNHVGFHIYPNPAMNHLSIELNQAATGQGKIYIIDAAGSRVKQISFVKDQQVFSKQLDLTGLKQGTYTVELWIKNHQSVVGKFFKY
jgi:hypothetical protein